MIADLTMDLCLHTEFLIPKQAKHLMIKKLYKQKYHKTPYYGQMVSKKL